MAVGGLVAPGAEARAAVSAGTAPCGRTSTAPTWHHVVVIVMENHSFSQVAGHSPYLNSLAARCGLATAYHAGWHPSLPNYIAMTRGATQAITTDCNPSPAARPAWPASSARWGPAGRPTRRRGTRADSRRAERVARRAHDRRTSRGRWRRDA